MIKQILGKLSSKPYSVSSPGESIGGAAAAAAYEPLPSFRDVPISEKPGLFLRKLDMCCLMFDFSDAGKYAWEKEVKRQMLLELVDYVSNVSTKFDETAVQGAMKMVEANIFDSPSYSTSGEEAGAIRDFDVEDEELALELSWPHLQVVYEFFLMFVSSAETDVEIAKHYVNKSFILHLLDLFHSKDPRVREYLKVILHQIYEKFLIHRPFIRKEIEITFCEFIYVKEKHNGIMELLEILRYIINGFSMPLKQERELVLFRVLIPLHKSKRLAIYHKCLSYCITEIVKKDKKLADLTIKGLLMCWPPSNSPEEVLFLEEIEKILEATQQSEFERCMVPLFEQVARCLNSSHVKVAERALFLWINVHVQELIGMNLEVILPIITPDMGRNMEGYGNPAARGLTLNLRKLFLDINLELMEKCLPRFQENEVKETEIPEVGELTQKHLNVTPSRVTSKEIAESRDSFGRDVSNLPLTLISLQLSSTTMKQFCFKWELPPMGWAKVNFAGVVHEGSKAGAGALIRDWQGHLICAVAVGLDTYSVPLSELQGAWEGLRMASTLEGYKGIWLEGYSQRVITSVERALQANTTIKYKGGLVDILHWITSFSAYQCTFMYREGNKPADFLANLGLSTSKFFASEKDIPMELLHLIKQDREGGFYNIDDPRVLCWMKWSGPSKYWFGGSSGHSSPKSDLSPSDTEWIVNM